MPIICFSGFKDSDKIYSNFFKEELSEKVLKLKGTIINTPEFSKEITHVVTPPNSRTMKTLAAVLTHKW